MMGIKRYLNFVIIGVLIVICIYGACTIAEKIIDYMFITNSTPQNVPKEHKTIESVHSSANFADEYEFILFAKLGGMYYNYEEVRTSSPDSNKIKTAMDDLIQSIKDEITKVKELKRKYNIPEVNLDYYMFE